MPYTYDYPRPSVTADCIVFRFNQTLEIAEVLLIKRKANPFKNHWAFPGGFVNVNEDLRDAAERELKEETGLTGVDFKPLFPVGTPDRDPRGHVITCPFVATTKSKKELKARDDAKELKWWNVEKLPKLAFDHKEILKMAIQHTTPTMVSKMVPAKRGAFYDVKAQRALSKGFLSLFRD